jgi:hypothetical protein
MEQYEYDIIMDNCSRKYNVELNEKARFALVVFHQRITDIIPISFEYLCTELVLEEMCKKLRPDMDLYTRVFSPQALN